MDIRKVEITLGRTVNLGHFDSFHCRVAMSAEFEKDEYSDEKYEELRARVYNKVQTQVARIMPD